MSVLDELREAVTDQREHERAGEGSSWNDALDEALAALDVFEAAHPGLVDLTICGKQCPVCWLPLAAFATTKPLCLAMSKDAPVGEPCPCYRKDAP